MCTDFSEDEEEDSVIASYRSPLSPKDTCSTPVYDAPEDDSSTSVLRGSPPGSSPDAGMSFDASQGRSSSSDPDESLVLRGSELQRLHDEFSRIRMTFMVRCRYGVCSIKVGPLQEIWQNNVTVRGVLLRRMQCLHCRERYVGLVISLVGLVGFLFILSLFLFLHYLPGSNTD